MADYLAGKTEPRRETILAIADVARVGRAWLLDGSPPEPELLPQEEGSAALRRDAELASELVDQQRGAEAEAVAAASGRDEETQRAVASIRGLSGEPYRHEPGPSAPVEPPPPPAAAIVADDLLVELFHRVAALYLSERLPTSAESELRNAIALYNELVEKHGPQGPPADAITARLKAFRDYLRREREAILRGGRET